jgi:hypothetical protein
MSTYIRSICKNSNRKRRCETEDGSHDEKLLDVNENRFKQIKLLDGSDGSDIDDDSLMDQELKIGDDNDNCGGGKVDIAPSIDIKVNSISDDDSS